MAYRTLDSGLGFSLKPPKWIRKAQPGKILAKAALPIAAVGAAILIPGAGAALVGAAKAAIGGASKLISKSFTTTMPIVRKVVADQGTSILTNAIPMNSAPSGDVSSGMPQTQATPFIAPPEGAGPEAPAPSGAAAPMPSWAIPAAIGVALLLFGGGFAGGRGRRRAS